jgi:hypothetical protein
LSRRNEYLIPGDHPHTGKCRGKQVNDEALKEICPELPIPMKGVIHLIGEIPQNLYIFDFNRRAPGIGQGLPCLPAGHRIPRSGFLSRTEMQVNQVTCTRRISSSLM